MGERPAWVTLVAGASDPLRMACAIAGMLAALLAGCSAVPGGRTEAYRCAGGKGFALVVDPRAGARVEMAGMSFPVYAEGNRDGVYACEVLTVWRDGRTAWMDLQGRPELRDCVRVP